LILYLDSSAIVKQYAVERGSAEIQVAAASAQIIGTTVLSRAEVAAAFKKGCRTKALNEKSAKTLLRDFNREWPNLIRLRVTERLTKHASTLAWDLNLRGYDSVHLASAAAWQQALERAVTVATFDSAMWEAAQKIGLASFPPDLPQLLESWRTPSGVS